MKLSRWMAFLGVVVGFGCLKVAQRNAIVLKGYALGERMGRMHRQETDAMWLSAQVVGLASPTHLSQVAQEHKRKFVAWSTLSAAPSLASDLPVRPLAGLASRPANTEHIALIHVASVQSTQSPGQSPGADETAD